MINSVIGRVGLYYALQVPDHRGKAFALRQLDRLCGPFQLQADLDGLWMATYLSSSMDVSYLRKRSTRRRVSLDELPLRAVNSLRSGDVFIDIGANTGFLSLSAAKRVGPDGLVLAFEPSKREFARLIHNCRINGVNNVVCLNSALGREDGLARLRIERDHTGLNSLSVEGDSACGTELVAVLAAGRLLTEWVPNRRTLVKIDVEGAELRVVRGMLDFLRERRPEAVVIEVTERFLRRFGDSKRELYDAMAEAGYCGTTLSDEDQYDEYFVRKDTVGRVDGGGCA